MVSGLPLERDACNEDRRQLVVKWVREHVLFVVLLIIAAGMRLYLWKHTPVSLDGDMIRYNAMAQNIVQHGYLGAGAVPSAFITPGYPLFVAFFYRFVGLLHARALTHLETVHEVFFFQQLLSLVSLWLIYRIGCQLRGKWVGLIAALLSVLYIQMSFVGLMLLTEALFIPLFLATISMALAAMKSQKVSSYLWTGLLLSLTTLVRPTVLPFWLVILALDFWQRYNNRDRGAGTDWRRQFWPGAIWLTVGVIVPLIPWWIRNLIDFHHFILLDNDSGNPLLAGAIPYFRVNINTLIAASRALHESQDTYAIHYALAGFKAHFWLYAGWYLFGKLQYLIWSPWLYQYIPAFVLYHRVVVIIGAILMFAFLGRSQIRVIAWISLILILLQMAFLPTFRYGYPIILLWLILIPAALDVMWEGYRRRKTEPTFVS